MSYRIPRSHLTTGNQQVVSSSPGSRAQLFGGATGHANVRTESMLEDEELNPFQDPFDWFAGEGDGRTE